MFDRSKKLTKEIWWLLLFTGVAGMAFGLIMLLWPNMTIVTLVYLVAVFMVVNGVAHLLGALANIKKDRLWWLAMLLGVVNLGVGVYLLRNPMVLAAILVLALAAMIVVQSIFDLVIASYTKKEEGRWLWTVAGLLGLISSAVLMLYPVKASLAFVWVLGLYAVIHGVSAVSFALQIRREIKRLK